jgi:hypothetical protein
VAGERTYVWAVTFSFYKAGICGGTVTANVLALKGLRAVTLARKHREEIHKTEFESFEVQKLEQICEVHIQEPKP